MTAAGSQLVSLHGVGKTYANGVSALGSLDLAIRSGEFVSLLGPSGCGKSTALRLIAGLDEPSQGRIERPGLTGDVGFVFQDPTLMPWANLADNVWLPLRLRGYSKRAARERIAEALSLVGLSSFAKAYPRELSGGMRMRASIARALTVRPQLLLMDEPFAALDEITRFRLNDDLLRLQRELGCTIVFVTHSVYESAYLSSRIAILSPQPGRIVADIAGVPAAERGSDFRTSSRYTDLCRDVAQALAEHASPEAL